MKYYFQIKNLKKNINYYNNDDKFSLLIISKFGVKQNIKKKHYMDSKANLNS